ncbi:MAG: MOSC domain-containing protein [Gammaproteobacteria bacterium]
MSVTITGLYCGQRGTTLPDGTASGMRKGAVPHATVGPLGLIGDYQADRLVHGGADKAVHHYPAAHYAHLAAAFPAAAHALVAGSLGENLSSSGIDEHGVHIGDVYACGAVRLQLTQPRRPCWKIDQHHELRGLAALIARAGRTGWYYRVLTGGRISAGMPCELIDRDAAAPSIAELHATLAAARPPLDTLARYATLAALPAALRRRIATRLAWLRRHPAP